MLWPIYIKSSSSCCFKVFLKFNTLQTKSSISHYQIRLLKQICSLRTPSLCSGLPYVSSNMCLLSLPTNHDTLSQISMQHLRSVSRTQYLFNSIPSYDPTLFFLSYDLAYFGNFFMQILALLTSLLLLRMVSQSEIFLFFYFTLNPLLPKRLTTQTQYQLCFAQC